MRSVCRGSFRGRIVARASPSSRRVTEPMPCTPQIDAVQRLQRHHELAHAGDDPAGESDARPRRATRMPGECVHAKALATPAVEAAGKTAIGKPSGCTRELSTAMPRGARDVVKEVAER